MPLTPGERLGPYEILAPIGAGGMGEVYRARDTRLKREVALKVLPAAFANDPGRMMRFQREAEVLASLNHPNIAQIYGVEERALAMELVEGESPKGPLPFDEAWKIALQIADALEYAHEKGVIHRDLKPANVMVTPGGVVKLLDFGLAKAFSGTPESAMGDPANSPTLTLGATVAGTILGTAAYMSPEQARGKSADKRADIWSWGVVLWELLTGERLFGGEDAVETLGAVIHKQPDLERVPYKVRRLLRRCLEKDPKNRLRDIGEARFLLDEEAAPVKLEATPKAAPSSPWALYGAVAVLAMAAAGLGWIAWRATRPVERPLVRLDVDVGSDVTLPPAVASTSSVVLSPDGTRLAYAATVAGQPKLYTRRLDQAKAAELPGTEGAQGPFFSPDGQWIGFWAAGKLNKISVEGGASVPLGDVSTFAGAWLMDDGNILVGEPLARGLLRIPSGGGSATVIRGLRNGELALAYPQALPGGKAVLFTDYKTIDARNASIEVFTFSDQKEKTVAQGGVSARYLPTSAHAGHLLYTNKSTLLTVPFDLDRLETRGAPTPILDDVMYSNPGPESAQFAFSPSGALVYRKSGGPASSTSTVQWVDPSGKKQPLLSKPGVYTYPRLSPDGKLLAVSAKEGSSQDIVVYDEKRDATTKLTFGGGLFDAPVWSPDGHFVVFASIGSGLFWARADGGGQPQPLTQGKSIQLPWSFTGDGKRFAYVEAGNGPAQIWTVPVEQHGGQLKAGKPERFRASQFQDLYPAFLPDGRFLAYTSNSSGKEEVYVRAFPDNGSQWQISNNGGTRPLWSPNGHDLLYQAGDQIMAASYTVKGAVFQNEKPRVWIAKLGGMYWDVDASGNRVAVITAVETPEAPKADHTFTLLLNFFDELKRRAPLEK